MDDLLREFVAEASEHLDTVDRELVRLERDPSDQAILRKVFRLVHTIKGPCGFLGLPRLEALAHAAETVMGALRDGAVAGPGVVPVSLATIDRIKLILAELGRTGKEPSGSDQDLIAELDRAAHASAPPSAPALPDISGIDAPIRLQGSTIATAALEGARAKHGTVRVGVDAIEHLMSAVSELALIRTRLLEVASRAAGDSGLMLALHRLSTVTAELQEGIARTRMQPLSSVWAKLPRLVRDLASELGKSVELVQEGGETELDREVLELIGDSLMHMVRNAADHGIEPPAERIALGKPARGTITLSARQEGGSVTIDIQDDGRGLDWEAIRGSALKMKLADGPNIAAMSQDRLAELIFHPGLTTSRSIGSVSGRGVGMDVVRTNLDLVGGTIDTRSEAGRGTSFRLWVPRTVEALSGGRAEGYASRSGGAALLLVEPNRFIRDMLVPVLAGAGYDVEVATSADEALRAILARPVHILATALDLPDRDGLDLAAAARRHPVLRSIPVVVLSTGADPATMERSRALGVAAVVPKFDREGLIAALERMPPTASGAAA